MQKIQDISIILLTTKNILDWIPLYLVQAPLAQLDRASDYGSEGWGFDSLKVRHFFKSFLYPFKSFLYPFNFFLYLSYIFRQDLCCSM